MGDNNAYDVAVIGAGINGAGIARDAAMRGLRVIILDKNDLCTGCSAASSRLIHGGLRYLEYAEFPLVFESLRERITLRRIAGHLVKPLRICIPIYKGAKRGPLLIRLGMILYDLLSLGKTVPGHDMLGGKAAIDNEPGLKRDGLRAAARYYDAQVAFAERLVLENLVAARAAGADICTYSEVTRINVDAGAVTGLDYVDTITGEKKHCQASVVINAGGPWVDRVLATAGTPQQQFIGGTVGSHIIVSAFDGAPADAYYVEAESDGRPFFILPWNDLYLIGTTDIRYDGSLDEVRASGPEVDYLLAETNRVFPSAGLSREDIHYTYAGIRPLPKREGGPESSITRKHIIRKNRELARGLVSIIGGKLTTFRSLAEQCVDLVGKELGRKLPPCRTEDTRLPGAYRVEEAESTLAGIAALSGKDRERLLALYGGRAIDVVALLDDGAADLLEAQVIFAIRDEMARTLADIVYRRLMTGLDADQGRPDYERIAAIAAREFGWSDEERQARLEALIRYSDSFKVR